MKKTKLSTPVRYTINIVLTIILWALLTLFVSSSGLKGEYYRGILITIGINIILATSLNVVCGYLGQLPLGHAGFMAVGAYAGAIFMKSTPAATLLRAGNHAAVIPYIIIAVLISAVVAGIFGLLIGIPALRLKGDYLAIITLGFGEIIRVVLTNIDSVLGFKFTYGASGLARIPKFTSLNVIFVFTVVCL
ncbi:MAG: branched-chain amino acid ABC transporter permease, partial [Spirochaetales bacterium]|nr:branched-chain amino acid ABC transporter permease [Spirochaetales bacterium]